MKKYLMSGLAILCLIGVSGCMGEQSKSEIVSQKDTTSEIDTIDKKDQELVKKMLDYVNEVHNENFKAYKFFPSQKGFNKDASRSFLLAENAEGINIVMSMQNDQEGIYYSNYRDVNYSKLLTKNYETMKKFDGKMMAYASSLEIIDLTREEMAKDVLGIAERSSRIVVRVQVDETLNEADLEAVKDFYNYLITINPVTTFAVAVTNNDLLTNEYFAYFNYYDKKYKWEEFDTNVTHKLVLASGKPVTLSEVKSKFIEVN